MIAVDTNILVHAHRTDSEFHAKAEPLIRELAEGTRMWAIPWPCIHEFFSCVTRPRLFNPPSTTSEALQQIDYWLSSPSLALFSESGSYWPRLRPLIEDGKIAGPVVHDARVAALCLEHGVDELLTMDRDFSRFPGLKKRNPLQG